MRLEEATHTSEFMSILSVKNVSELSGTPLYKKAKEFLKAEKELYKMLELSGRGTLTQLDTGE